MPNQTDIINDFLKRVYLWMVIALLISAVTAWYVAGSQYLLEIIFSGLFWVIVLIELALVIIISWAIEKLSEQVAGILFVIYSIFTGLTLAIIFVAYTLPSIQMVFMITASIFVIMALIGYTTKRDLSSLGLILFVGLIGIIIAMIVNIFLQSEMMAFIVSIIAVIIFTGLIMYDVNRLKKVAIATGRNNGKYAIRGALSLYLDFINLFLHLLRLLGRRR